MSSNDCMTGSDVLLLLQLPASGCSSADRTHKKSPASAGQGGLCSLRSADDFVSPVHENRVLGVGDSSVVLDVLLAAVGQGHGRFLEASSGPRSMA